MNNIKPIATLGSLFDGIGGFPYAGSFYGIQPVWASEIMAQAVSVTMRHFPEMEHVGDITKLDGSKLPPVDIIAFGSPCQDLSTAGRRLGMKGDRSGLFTEAIRIIDEMRRTTNGKYPRYAVWENVPGAMSSGKPAGSDFRAVLEAFTKTKIPMPASGRWANAGMVRGDGLDLAWRVLNAQHFGIPQRRRRVFLICDFGGESAGEVLFIEKGMRGNTAQGGQTRQGTAAHAQRGARDADSGSGRCLNPWDTQQSRVFTGEGNSPTLAGADGGGGRNPAGLVFCSASSQSHAGISEELSGALTCQHEQPYICEPELARTLTARGDSSPCADRGQNVVAVSVHQNGTGELSVSDTAKSLTTMSTSSCRNAPLVAHVNGVTSKGNGDCFLSPESHGALSCGGGQAGQGYPAVLCAATAQANAEISDSVCPTITEAAGTSGNNKPYIVHPDVSGTLCASGAGMSRPAGMASEPDLCVAYALQGNMIGRKDKNGPRGSGVNENLSFTLTATDTPAVAAHEPIPIHDKATRYKGGGPTRNDDGAGNGLGVGKTGDPAPTITAGDHHSVATIDCRNHRENGDVCGTLQAKGTPGYSLNCQNPVRTGYIVRRLTPTECERLQGFPDGWTEIGHDGKVISDTRRYQMLGNSVAIPCVSYIMQGIVWQMKISEMKEAA